MGTVLPGEDGSPQEEGTLQHAEDQLPVWCQRRAVELHIIYCECCRNSIVTLHNGIGIIFQMTICYFDTKLIYNLEQTLCKKDMVHNAVDALGLSFSDQGLPSQTERDC